MKDWDELPEEEEDDEEVDFQVLYNGEVEDVALVVDPDSIEELLDKGYVPVADMAKPGLLKIINILGANLLECIEEQLYEDGELEEDDDEDDL